jgi:hypothetical protein
MALTANFDHAFYLEQMVELMAEENRFQTASGVPCSGGCNPSPHLFSREEGDTMDKPETTLRL